RWLGACDIERRDIGEKTVASSGDGLDEARMRCRIAERLADLGDGLVDAVIEIDDRMRPDSIAELFPRHQLARSFEQHGEHSEGLLLQALAKSALRQSARPKIDLEGSKAKASRCGHDLHRKPESFFSSSTIAFS